MQLTEPLLAGRVSFREGHPLSEVSVAFKNPCEIGVLEFGVKLLPIRSAFKERTVKSRASASEASASLYLLK